MDAAAKSAGVRLLGSERVIGVGKLISLTLNIVGDVAAVQAAVEAGAAAAARVGTVVSTAVIPNPHGELDKIFQLYDKSFLDGYKNTVTKDRAGSGRNESVQEGAGLAAQDAAKAPRKTSGRGK
jgi:microcompartment protein CcmL/EutN